MEVARHGTSNRLPTFFIVGAPKAGTTSLCRYLDQHPQIYMSPVKEPCYFASEVRPEAFSPEFRQSAREQSERLRSILDNPAPGSRIEGITAEWEDYLKLFSNANSELAIGEASVCYLWSATAAANIHSKIPGAKIVMILRDPAERAFSQYLHNAADGVVKGSFREQIELGARNTRRQFHPLYPFLENGLYYEQVKRYLDLFPRQSVRIALYEEAWRNPLDFLNGLFGFLNVDSGFLPDLSRRDLESRTPRFITAHYLLRRSGAGRGLRTLLPNSVKSRVRQLIFKPGGSVVMEASDRRYLRDYYRDNVSKLEGLIDRDLHAWLD